MLKRVLVGTLLFGLWGCGGGDGTGSSGATSGSAGSSSSNLATSNRLVPPAPPPRPGSARFQTISPRQDGTVLPRQGPLSVTLQTGWNSVAVPFQNPTTFTLDNPSNVLACARYDASTGVYVDQSFSQNGFTTNNPFTGYWVYCSANTQWTVDGVDQTQTALSTSLVQGWNLVGTPLGADVPVSELQYNAGSLSTAFASFTLWPGVLTYHNGGYVETGHPPTALPVLKSQWIYAYQAGTLRRDVINLASNLSFEQPIAPVGSFQDVFVGDTTTIPGWRVIGTGGGNVALIGKNFTFNGFTLPAQDGDQYVDLTGYSDLTNIANVGVEQTLSTIPGRQYRVSFYIGNVVNPSGVLGTTSTVNVLVNGSQVFTATNSGGTGNNINWQQFSTTFTASGATTTLAFMNGDPASDTANGLDHIVVTLEP